MAKIATSADSTTSAQRAGREEAGQAQAALPSAAAGAGSSTSVQRAGQGQVALPSSAVRKTTPSSSDPRMPRREQAQAAAAFFHASGSPSVRRRQAQAAAPEPSVAALRWGISELAIDDDNLWRGEQRERRAPQAGMRQASRPSAGGGGTPSLPTGGGPASVGSPDRDESLHTEDARATVFKLLSEGKTVLDIARITGIVIKTIQKWEREMNR